MTAEKITLNKRFGRWTVIARGPSLHARWLCRCDCGYEALIRATRLRAGESWRCTSCAAKARALRHGQSTSAVYKRWRGMIDRCFNPSTANYKYYGGRGISVCDRWQKFENFLADMGEPPPGLTLDRINNNGNYEPDNCRWATWFEQARNKARPSRDDHLRV